MLRITSVSPGAVDYLLRGSGCAEHEHAGEASAQGGGRTADAVGYLLAGAATEPAGVWGGEGMSMLGVQTGTAATEAQVRAVFGRLEHPTRVDAKTGEPLPLGSRPRTFQPRDERIARALAAEPDATEERRAEIRNEAYAQTRKAVAYYDLTFSPVKSVSVYWTALLEAGRDAEAADVLAAHRAGVAAAMAYVEQQAAYVRSGYHGKTTSGQSVGVYEQARGLAWIRWDHSTSRAQQPQLHSHVTVPNRAETTSDGAIRALASRGFTPIKQAADAIYTKVSHEMLAASNGVVFATRPDGKAREIVGFKQQLLAKASSRTADITARQDELVRHFEEAHGRAPSPVETRRIHRAAWRETRQAKNHAVAPRRQLANWAEPVRSELTDALTAADAAGEWVARDGHPEQQGYQTRDREQVLRAALRTVQDRYATWDIGNLAAAIADEQVRTPAVTEAPQDLAAEVLREGDRYGVVMLSVRDVGTVPPELRRPDGLSRYRMRNAAEYATTAQLATEATIVERARGTGAAALAGPTLELARVELQAAGLGADQQAAVLQILSSGRRGDVLIGPAGAGKSRTVGALAQVWEQQIGGRVLGVATSQAATQVLIEDGLTALNTKRFLNRFAPDEQGRVRDRLRPEDLVVIDEAGMTSTEDLDRISAIAAAGAKLLYTGDHEQLAAVQAGGMLELLVRDTEAVELTEIHRFTHAWERAASVRLRVGDPDVVSVYDAHGRIRGGTEQEMLAAAVRGYLADFLEGHRSLLVVRTDAMATELSADIRAELVAAGRVSAEVLGQTRDGNLIGVGDLIQARLNDYTLRVHSGRPVTNREVYEVLGRNRLTGTLTVRDRDGIRAHLPDAYMQQHTTLAYVVTAYGAQGQNVDTSHSLIDRGTTRAEVYVPGSRGRDANTFYVVCRHAPDHHDPERIDSTPVAVLTDILTRPADATPAAELARRAGAEETRSLAWVGTQWDLLTAECGRHRATDTLAGLLTPNVLKRLVDEPGYARLMAAVRSVDLAGHDPRAVLAEAVARGSLHDAHSVSDVLRYRIRLLDSGGRTPERAVRDGDWTTFAAPWPGPVGDHARVLAAAATARQTELGDRAAAHPPAWTLAAPTLGPPPADPRQRGEWVRRAGIVAAYRDLHAIPDTQVSIGQAPSRERALHHALWRQALTALGHPADALDYATARDTELRAMRDAWRRAQAWAPQFVAEDLRAARELAEEYRRDAVIWRAGLHRHPDGSPDRELAERDLAAAEQLATVSAARVDALERIQAVRTDWLDRNRELQERAAFAGDELERRGLDRHTAPIGEQQELFTTTTDAKPDTAPDTDDADATTIRGARGLDPAQHQLDLDGVPRAVPTAASTRREDTEPTTSSTAGSAIGRGSDPTAGDAQRRAAAATRGAAARPAEPPGTTPDGYAELFAEAERAANREREQPALFDAQPTPADVAAAQPLHVDDTSGGRSGTGVEHTEDESTADDSALTVSQATRQAEIIAELRGELDARAAAAAPPPPRRRSADPDDEDLDIGAARYDIGSRSEAAPGQGLST